MTNNYMTQITKNIAVYIRTATTDEAAVNKRRIDLNEYTAELTHNGEQLKIEEYTDLGYGGNTMDRPALTKLVSDSQSGIYDLIVVTDSLQLSCNSDDADDLVRTLENAGSVVEFLSDPQLLTDAGHSIDGKKMADFAKTQHNYYTYIIDKMDEEMKKNDKAD